MPYVHWFEVAFKLFLKGVPAFEACLNVIQHNPRLLP